MRLARTCAAAAAGSLALLSLAVGTGQAAPSAPATGAALATSAPAGAGHGTVKVRWDWTMPTFMVDKLTFVPTDDKSDPDWVNGGSYVKGPDGIPDDPMAAVGRYPNAGPATYGKFPTDDKFAVKLDATHSTGRGTLRCSWDIRTKPVTHVTNNCAKKKTISLPEGRYGLHLTVTDSHKNTKTIASHITVKNVLIAVMGDSYGSGEGFPPFTEATADGKGRQLDWDYPSCNRTRWSGFVRGAQAVESADKRSNVTLVDVACAGGEIDKGYIRSIESVAPPVTKENPTGGILYPKPRLKANGIKLPGYEQPQIDQVRRITRNRTLDSVLLSIGGNDTGLSDIGIACALEDIAKPNCYNAVPFYWDTKPNAKPLYQVIDRNLVDLAKRTQRMAPCFGEKGTCETTKLKGGKPAKKATPSKPLRLVRDKNLVHAMYPDLTTTTEAGAIVPCSNKFPPESPMNQLDNTWAWDSVYAGRAGKPYTLPDTYSPPLPKPDPKTITPKGNSIPVLLKQNQKQYGWSPALSMLKASRGHGLCAGDEAWEYGLTQATVASNPANSGAALHPNDAGQQAYADMLGPKTQRLTHIPVAKPRSVVLNGLG
ncbi:MAG: hypothetical protein U0R64_00065 [Candidatus Nanopelagicales bacterium]